MTREPNIKIIRGACIAANPAIVELRFGCEFKFTEEYDNYEMGFRNVEDVCIAYREDTDAYGNPYLWINGVCSEYEFTTKEEIEIIGRPIRLADVLLAIWKQDKCKGADILRTHTGNIASGGFKETNLEHIVMGLWNLLKDDLEEQSDETVEFISNLLSNE